MRHGWAAAPAQWWILFERLMLVVSHGWLIAELSAAISWLQFGRGVLKKNVSSGFLNERVLMECKNRIENNYLDFYTYGVISDFKASNRPVGCYFLVLHKTNYTLLTAEWLLASSLTSVVFLFFFSLSDSSLLCSLTGFFFPARHTVTTVLARVALTSAQILALFKLL